MAKRKRTDITVIIRASIMQESIPLSTKDTFSLEDLKNIDKASIYVVSGRGWLYPEERLNKIAKILEMVDHRCQFGAVITPTKDEIRTEELKEIYKLAKGW